MPKPRPKTIKKLPNATGKGRRSSVRVAAKDVVVGNTISADGRPVEVRRTGRGKVVLRIAPKLGHKSQSQFQAKQVRKLARLKEQAMKIADVLWTPMVQGGSPGLKK